jgi:proteasome lid subunit RPN8/RPN11
LTDDIQFGEVQEARPEQSLRPDRNAHYAVAAYENPVEGEIPVFLDLDVMLDMEAHAASDTSVELGGVLLGGQFEDEEGRPFVLITDSLRAKHYESTKGSFKFTKEAWTEITRERNGYPDDLQMVGWYHTHPDWGVFLSGMDMFICDNFFNRPLDMAYVIDPCRGDRAFFQWTNNPRERCKRQRGFYVIASRYRAEELSAAVAMLQEGKAMPADNRLSGYPGMGAPVINVTQPPQSSHHNLAVLGMLAIQVCLLMLLVWKLAGPASESETELAKITKQLEQIAANEDAARTHKAVVAVLDEVLAAQQGTKPGLVERLAELQKQNSQLASASEGNAERAKQLLEQLKTRQIEFDASKAELEQTLSELRQDRTRLLAEKKALQSDLARYKAKDGESGATPEANWTMYWVGGLVLGVIAIGGIVATLAYRPTTQDAIANQRLAEPPAPVEKTPPASQPTDQGA